MITILVREKCEVCRSTTRRFASHRHGSNLPLVPVRLLIAVVSNDAFSRQLRIQVQPMTVGLWLIVVGETWRAYVCDPIVLFVVLPLLPASCCTSRVGWSMAAPKACSSRSTNKPYFLVYTRSTGHRLYGMITEILRYSNVRMFVTFCCDENGQQHWTGLDSIPVVVTKCRPSASFYPHPQSSLRIALAHLLWSPCRWLASCGATPDGDVSIIREGYGSPCDIYDLTPFNIAAQPRTAMAAFIREGYGSQAPHYLINTCMISTVSYSLQLGAGEWWFLKYDGFMTASQVSAGSTGTDCKHGVLHPSRALLTTTTAAEHNRHPLRWTTTHHMGNSPPGPPPPSGDRVLRCKDLFMREFEFGRINLPSYYTTFIDYYYYVRSI